jgi:ArsR family transcriptional regulator
MYKNFRDYVVDDDVVYATTQIFDALSDYTRLRILLALAQGERNAGDLADVCNVSASAVSHQLRLLRDRGLVSAQRDGKYMVYRLNDEHVSLLLAIGLEHAHELGGN